VTRRLLVVSNGYSEDLIAAQILRQLPEVDRVAYPLVGLGDGYPPDVARLGPRRVFPSGGFALRTGMRGLWADLRSGAIPFWVSQFRTLRRQRGRAMLALTIGDTYALMMAAQAGVPVVLVATADSVRIRPFGALQYRALRRAQLVFTRDAETAEALLRRDIAAVHAGTASMDCLEFTGSDLGIPAGRPVVVLLPGSRGDAPANARLLAGVADRVGWSRPEVSFIVPLADAVDERAVMTALSAPQLVATRAFADALARATVVVGMAGTAHEQAAGLGKPVVAFPGPGPQFTPQFLHDQGRLLGDALVAVSSAAEAAEVVLRLLASPEERERRGRAGRERIGGPGATWRIATTLRELLRDVTEG